MSNMVQYSRTTRKMTSISGSKTLLLHLIFMGYYDASINLGLRFLEEKKQNRPSLLQNPKKVNSFKV